MPLIQKPDIGIRLKKFLGLTSLPDSILGPEVVATVQVGDLTLGATDRLCMGTRNELADVGELPLVALRNQPAAGTARDVAVKCTDIFISTNTTQFVILALTGAALGTLTQGTKSFTDLDQVGDPSTEVGGDSVVAEPADRRIGEFEMAVDDVLHIPMEFVFGTVGATLFQNSLFVLGLSTNTRMTVVFKWIESSPSPE